MDKPEKVIANGMPLKWTVVDVGSEKAKDIEWPIFDDLWVLAGSDIYLFSSDQGATWYKYARRERFIFRLKMLLQPWKWYWSKLNGLKFRN